MRGAYQRLMRHPALVVVVLLAYVTILVFLCRLAVGQISVWQEENRGIVYGDPPSASLDYVQPMGVNVSLEQYESEEDLRLALSLIQQGGFHWVRQSFPWSEIEPQPGDFRWDRWDRIVGLVQEQGLELIAVLEGSPEWARADADVGNPLAPPQSEDFYAAYVEAYARRYGDVVDYYQIWDQPNIAPHWGARDVDPSAYVRLLRAGWLRLKSTDDRVYVLGAALAPNIEPGGRNMNEIEFLRQVYREGGGAYFDILAAKPYGFWSGPHDRRVDPSVLNFSRLILLREEMVRQGDGDKPIWAVEFGWNALPGEWPGLPSPWGTDSEEKQAQRTLEALERTRQEWPWLGAVCLQHFQPILPLDDPTWGFSLLDASGEPRLLYHQLLHKGSTAWQRAYPGRYSAASWVVERQGEWAELDGTLISYASQASLVVPFWGTRLDLEVEAEGRALRIWLDGGQSDTQDKACSLVKEVDLAEIAGGCSWIVAAKGLPAGEHTLRLEAVSENDRGVIIRRFVVRRDSDFGAFYRNLTLLGLAMLIVTWRGLNLAARLPWRSWWTLASGWYFDRSEWLQWVLVTSAIAVYYSSPWLPVSLLALLTVVALFYLRRDLALVSIVVAAPLAVYSKPLGSMRFSLVEVLSLCALLAHAIHWLQDHGRKIRGSIGRSGIRVTVAEMVAGLDLMDKAVLFFLVVSLLSLATSANLRVSLRELRTVVLEPVVFYLLIRDGHMGRRKLLWLGDAFVAVGLVLSLHGLYQYAFTDDVIVAEGVRRVRGIYGSPNNMGLLLGRLLPVAVAMAWTGRTTWRRWLYGGACVPIMLCLFLTYSRGAWLLGVPGAMIFLGLLRGRRSFTIVLGIVLVALLSLIPLAGSERIASIFQFQEGTGFLRQRLWESALHMIRDHPLSGIGLDNFLYLYPDYMLPGAEIEPNLSHPHNIILDYWTRLGILGVVSLAWLLGTFFRAGLRLYRSQIETDSGAVALGLMASMVAFVTHGMIDSSYFVVELAFVFFMSLGVLRCLQEGCDYAEKDLPLTLHYLCAILTNRNRERREV
ncbi:MAG: O-antigen ligase family protein [Chloroflexota bacterium]